MENTQPPIYDEKLKTTIRRASTHFTGSEAQWQRFAQEGATDQQIIEFAKKQIGYGGGSGGPDMHYVKQLTSPPRYEIRERPIDPPFLILQGKQLIL